MTRMNSRVDEIQDFVKMNVQLTTDKKGKQVTFTDQLPSQATANPRNQGASSSQTHNINHVHVDEEAVEMTLAISSLWSGKDLRIHTRIILSIEARSKKKKHQLSSNKTIWRTSKNRLRLNLILANTSPMCNILKHLIDPKPRVMKSKTIY